ncbi:MAG TPA: SIR2 family protein [Candidatus Angelobacter sp.]
MSAKKLGAKAIRERDRALKLANDRVKIANDLTSRIYDDIVRQGCVVFIGAGSTTEGKQEARTTFYAHIKELSEFAGDPPSFPELMQYFCDHMDGGHHNRLIREALSRIEEFCVRDSEANFFATRFTNALAEIPYFNRFVTTNWDPFLERSLDVLVPMVEDKDLAFWNDHKRQILKIHGCITRPYSIVATQSDYDTCMGQNKLIFNKPKDLMATKTFLFAGYSMRDPDFKKVWDSINGSLGHFANMAYALDPGAPDDQVSFWRERGIEIFRSADILFARALRERLEKEDLIPTSQFLGFLQRERDRITSIHLKMGQNSHGRFSSAMYQDGLLHELDSIFTATALGTMKKEDFDRDCGEKRRWLERAWRSEDLIEIAYRSGRVEVLERFNNRDKSRIPTYFHPDRLQPVSKLVDGKKYSSRPPRI